MGCKPGQRVSVMPFTPMTGKLAREIEKDAQLVLNGFVDSVKRGDRITPAGELAPDSFDKLIILSPNHGLAIYRQCLAQGIPKNKICLITPYPDYRQISPGMHKWQKAIAEIKPKVLGWLQRHTKKLFRNNNQILLLAPDFVDLNIKQTGVELMRRHAKMVVATPTGRQAIRLRQAGFPVVDINSWRFVWVCLRSAVVVMDHNPITTLCINSLIGVRRIQIWHGIPLKRIGHLVNYKRVKYDAVISTSSWVTQQGFEPVFDTQRFVETGYPRNDVLTQRREELGELALTNHAIDQWATATGYRTVIYMPTWRSDSFDNNPIDLDKLNAFCQQNRIRLVIKMHPFIRANAFFDSLETDQFQYRQEYSNSIVFYPSSDDIYPLLGRSDLLITDYSSVYFDYLLVDKPIIFFAYDLQHYETTHGGFMLSFHQHTPGDKPTNFEQLCKAISQNLTQDNYQVARQQLRTLLFRPQAQRDSAAQVADLIEQLMREG